MAIYANESYAGANDLKQMVEEPPLSGRLENVLGMITRCLRLTEEINHGPQPENPTPHSPVVGVLQLGAECEKATMALENNLMILLKRIGRL